jgi:predicted RNA binding protein YcfA (HicA-like mRNA interferase family)
MPPKVREILRRLHDDGWRQVRQTGSHRIFRHPLKRGTVTVPGHPNDEPAAGTWLSIQRQAEWRGDDRQ